jgi:hypothetical protein
VERLPRQKKSLLLQQLEVMDKYNNILKERLSLEGIDI